MKHLRTVVAESLLQWSNEDLLNFLVCYSLDEQAPDGWSPSQLLRDHGFGQLVGCDAVRAVGPDTSQDADRGDIVVALTQSSAEVGGAASAENLVLIPQGESLPVALKNALREEFQVCGDHYWGTTTDCRAISEHFDVGMLILQINCSKEARNA